jgi:hypothetical protein
LTQTVDGDDITRRARTTRAGVVRFLFGATPPSSLALTNRDGDVETARDE